MIKEINFSKKAVEKINQLIAKKPSGTFFRIAVKGGGCSGFKYDFTFDNKIDDNDLKHENIDNLKGLEVELIYEWEVGSMLIFDRTHLHCSSSVIEGNKIGIATFTKK